MGHSDLAPQATLIVLATPVDDITALAQWKTGLPPTRVMGFGGDLDRNRLASILLAQGMPETLVASVVKRSPEPRAERQHV